jgi:hypothetical protein
MSELGQTKKNSLRANVFWVTPENGHCSKLSADDFAALATTVDTEEFRAALGRVACGYDGGQIVDE